MRNFVATFFPESVGLKPSSLLTFETPAETLEEALDKFKVAHPDNVVLLAIHDAEHIGGFLKRIETDMKSFLADPAAAVKGLFKSSDTPPAEAE